MAFTTRRNIHGTLVAKPGVGALQGYDTTSAALGKYATSRKGSPGATPKPGGIQSVTLGDDAPGYDALRAGGHGENEGPGDHQVETDEGPAHPDGTESIPMPESGPGSPDDVLGGGKGWGSGSGGAGAGEAASAAEDVAAAVA